MQQPREASPLATPSAAAVMAAAMRAALPGPLDDVEAFLARFGERVRKSVYADPRVILAFQIPGIPTTPDSVAARVAQEGVRTWGLCRWYDCGLPVLAPTQSLAAALTLSSYPSLQVGAVPWPFDSYVIELPRPWLPPPFDTLSLIWVARSQAHASEDDTIIDVVRVESTGTDGVAYDRLARVTADVERWIENREIREFSAPMDDQEQAVGRLCTRLAVGLAIYMSTLTTATVAAAKRRIPASRRVPGAPPTPQAWDLGRDIKLPRELRLAAVDFANARRAVARSGWRLSRRFAVRGHFRRTVVGPRAVGERRWTWVKPFWKGPADGIALRRTYVVGETP